MNSMPSTQTTRQNILVLLDELPPDSLPLVEKFMRFVQTEPEPFATTPSKTPWLYPTVPVPADSLDNWMKLLSTGYEGDALADTEALYDEV